MKAWPGSWCTRIQNTRKAAGLNIEDRIDLWVEGPEEIGGMLEEHSGSGRPRDAGRFSCRDGPGEHVGRRGTVGTD